MAIVAAAALVVCLTLASSSFAQTTAASEPMTVDSVVTLSSVGLGDEAIIAKLRASGSSFNLSTAEMIGLKSKGVSGSVIAAMLGGSGVVATSVPQMSADSADPFVAHPTGVYLLAETPAPARMVRMNATVTSQIKTGGIWGYALTAGIASVSLKAVIQNETARVRSTAARPVFYMFYDESNPQGAASSSAWLAGTAATVTSPSEFTLIRLTRKDGRRESRVGSMNIGGQKYGVMDKDRIPFDFELIRPGVYKATVAAALEPGEYGFIYAISGGTGAGAMSARIFDFSVEGAVTAHASSGRTARR